jgi:DNA-binding GntR family transcriptional regulator
MTAVGGQALVDELAQRIQTRVLNGEIPMGTRLRQETLAAEFGVSRTPVREALRKLQASGLVEVQPRRGALVRGPNAREIREAYEVRAELEGLAAELAATRVRDAELRRLRDAQALFRHSGASILAWRRTRKPGASPPEGAHAEWIEGNDTFHLVIQEAAGNARLREMLTELHRSVPRDLTWIVLGENAKLLEENVAQHQAVLDAIERHDPEEARRRMVEHVRRAGELVTRRFEERA